jgi:hypothetical protein
MYSCLIYELTQRTHWEYIAVLQDIPNILNKFAFFWDKTPNGFVNCCGSVGKACPAHLRSSPRRVIVKVLFLCNTVLEVRGKT